LFGYFQRECSSVRSSLVETSHEIVELLAIKLPIAWSWRGIVKLLKAPKTFFDGLQRAEVVRCQDLALQNRNRDFNLIEPARMERYMPHDRVGILRCQTLARALTTMRRAIIYDPKHPLGMTIRRLLHHLIDQAAKRCDPGPGLAAANDHAPPDLPGGHILQGAPASVCRFHADRLTRPGRQAGVAADASVDARFFIAPDDKIMGPKELALPEAGVPIHNLAALGSKWTSRGKIQER
jgi:hypothetical protein